MRPVTMLMVNKKYVMPDHELHDGDELALIPPVSGGGQARFRVQSEPLDPGPRSLWLLTRAPGPSPRSSGPCETMPAIER